MVLERLKVGTHVFILESNRIATEVTIIARRGNFYTLKFQNGGAIQLRQNRIFLSKLRTFRWEYPVRAVQYAPHYE